MESKSIFFEFACYDGLTWSTPVSFVLFNRQPSLHKMSMMSHRVKLMPYSSAYSFPHGSGLLLTI